MSSTRRDTLLLLLLRPWPETYLQFPLPLPGLLVPRTSAGLLCVEVASQPSTQLASECPASLKLSPDWSFTGHFFNTPLANVEVLSNPKSVTENLHMKHNFGYEEYST